MPCLSSKADSALKASISVSKAESQLAVPLTITTFFGSSVASAPKGSAVCTGEGLAATAGDADGAGDAEAAGEGLAEAVGDAEAAGAGVDEGEGLAEAGAG